MCSICVADFWRIHCVKTHSTSTRRSFLYAIFKKTRMHPSRMRTARSSAVRGRGRLRDRDPLDRITDRCKNITFPQLRLRVVKIWEDTSPFCVATDTACFGLVVMSPLGLKARVGSLIRP